MVSVVYVHDHLFLVPNLGWVNPESVVELTAVGWGKSVPDTMPQQLQNLWWFVLFLVACRGLVFFFFLVCGGGGGRVSGLNINLASMSEVGIPQK